MGFSIKNGILDRFINDNQQADVIIPDGVVAIGEMAFMFDKYIVSVTIPEGVTDICHDAFYGCKSLTTVTLPDTVTNIEEKAFADCEMLTSVNMPLSLTHIGNNAFENCWQITSLKFPDGLEVIGDEAFSNCENLEDVNIPPSVREMGIYSFYNCKKITSITIPKSIDYIPEGAFLSCERLERVEIPGNITSIGFGAFDDCISLHEISIPKSVKVICKDAFGRCENLRRVTFPRGDIEVQLNAFFFCTDLITGLSIKQWKSDYGFSKLNYALYYMRQYTPGNPLFDDVKEENKAYIRGQMKKLLKMFSHKTYNYGKKRNDYNLPGISVNDTNVVIFLTQEKLLRIDEVELLLDQMAGNAEASVLLLDYKAKNFSKEFIEKYDADKLNKELGLKERTVAEWKQIYRLADDGNGGYKIIGYKGSDVDVKVPEKIGKKPVTAIGDFAFSPDAMRITHEIRDLRNSLETVIIPDSITTIGLNVFSYCINLNCILYQGQTFTPDEFEKFCHPKSTNP